MSGWGRLSVATRTLSGTASFSGKICSPPIEILLASQSYYPPEPVLTAQSMSLFELFTRRADHHGKLQQTGHLPVQPERAEHVQADSFPVFTCKY